jgi:hypothetical protein
VRLDRLSEATLLTGEALLATGGTALDTITACAGPVGIAVDATRRRIWVADSGVDRVVALAPDGTVQFVITGQAEARAIAIDEATGEAWVTVATAGAVSRLSPAGIEILRVGGLGRPRGPGGKEEQQGQDRRERRKPKAHFEGLRMAVGLLRADPGGQHILDSIESRCRAGREARGGERPVR